MSFMNWIAFVKKFSAEILPLGLFLKILLSKNLRYTVIAMDYFPVAIVSTTADK